jgi:uncharacterized SAM-binding protein YcdF (DUF218 family)
LILAALLLFAGALYLARERVLVGAARFLTVRDALEPCDVILVLSGGVNDRPELAAKLYARGLAPSILLIRKELSPIEARGLVPEEVILARRLLLAEGVPAAAIGELGTERRATSTFDEARLFRRYAREHGVRSVIVVTNPYHTRRARWIFRRVLRDTGVRILMAPSKSWAFSEENWWRNERGMITYVNEYIKFLWYLWRY